jgi:repressor LexA
VTSIDTADEEPDAPAGRPLSDRQRAILTVIEQHLADRGYPPSVREIGEAVGLTSPSTVHTHLATLQRLGYLRRDPTKPRALEVRYDAASGATAERAAARHVPLVGDVAAGTDVLAHQHVEELVPVPSELCGEGELFMLRVRGTSMIDAGILDGDLVVVRRQPDAGDGEIVVAGLDGEEATVKTLRKRGDTIVLEPANDALEPIEIPAEDAVVFGRVVTVLRKI